MTSIEDDETFCFEDSDIHVLSSEEDGTRWRFKVHKRVLQQSPVFNDMLALGEPIQPADTAGRSFVELQDHASDLENMFKKVYEGQQGYGVDIQTYEKMDPFDMADLACILDKFQWRAHSEEVKAALCANLKEREHSYEFNLDKIAELLPKLSQLDHRGIQSQLIKFMSDGLQDLYTCGDWDWTSEPDSYDEFASMDASLVAVDVYKEMMARLSETLLERQGETQVAQRKITAVHDFIKVLGRTISPSPSHEMMACWVGVTYPAWHAAIPQVMYRLWDRGLWENEFRFDQGEGKERDTVLEPLLELDEEELDDCEECQRTIKRATAFVRSKYPRKKDTEVKPSTAVPPVAPHANTVNRDTPTISDSRLFNLPDATIRILSAPCSEGRRTRYRMHKKLALASAVIRNLIGSENLADAQAGKEQVIEKEQSPAALNAAFHALYSEELGESSIPRVPRPAAAGVKEHALAYVALKELGFDSHADKVRGLLRLQLLSPDYRGPPLGSLTSLMQYAIQKIDDVMQVLVATCLQKNIGAQHWLKAMASSSHHLNVLPCSVLRNLVIQLLKAHGKERIKRENIDHRVCAIAVYGKALCYTPDVDDSHELYACYKLKCGPAWQAAQYKVVNLFLRNWSCVPYKAPDEENDYKNASFVHLYGQFMQVLEGLDIGTDCRICKQAIEDWVNSIRRVYYHEEEARKRNREEEEEKAARESKREEEETAQKRKRDQEDEGKGAADDAKKTSMDKT